MPEKTSIVLDLQRLASESATPITELLRKALIVATKLKIEDFRVWIQNELSGYAGGPIPKYRLVRGRLTAQFPGEGNRPMRFPDNSFEVNASTVPILHSVAEIEQLAQNRELLHVVLPAERVNLLHQIYNRKDFTPDLDLSPASMMAILDNVRKTDLEWALRLEQEGILGDGIMFSDDEKMKAQNSPNIHIGSIGTFTGTLGGNVTANNLQIGNFSTINEQLKHAGISQEDRNELENIMDAMKTAKPEDKPSVFRRGMEWVDKNKGPLGTLAIQLASWFSQHHHQ
jgi:hypothetical protein